MAVERSDVAVRGSVLDGVVDEVCEESDATLEVRMYNLHNTG